MVELKEPGDTLMWLGERGRSLVCIPGFLVSGLGDPSGYGYVSKIRSTRRRTDSVFSFRLEFKVIKNISGICYQAFESRSQERALSQI